MDGLLYDGISSIEDAKFKVLERIVNSYSDTTTLYFFNDEKKAYGCYLELGDLHSWGEDSRIVFLRNNGGSHWEIVAEDGMWCCSWRPKGFENILEAKTLYFEDDNYTYIEDGD